LPRIGSTWPASNARHSFWHPSIASIYGLEESGDRRALVMQLVERPTLAERVEEGAIPVDEAIT
jgi:hypothetical protein